MPSSSSSSAITYAPPALTPVKLTDGHCIASQTIALAAVLEKFSSAFISLTAALTASSKSSSAVTEALLPASASKPLTSFRLSDPPPVLPPPQPASTPTAITADKANANHFFSFIRSILSILKV